MGNNLFCTRKTNPMATISNTKGGTTLLLVDAQTDFHPGGSLEVPNSHEDAERIASVIRSSISDPKAPKIDRIVATMDSHHILHIAHPKFWTSGNSGGEGETNPGPFTLISCEDVKSGKWIPRKDIQMPLGVNLVHPNIMQVGNLYDADGNLDILAYCIEYTARLEKSGKFQLCIWPEHCLIGTPGHGIYPIIRQAMDEWSSATGRSAEFIMKGQNLFTEMYSAFRAEVEISPETCFNKELLNSLRESDRILVCGQALSHCVNHTIRDLIDNMEGEEYKVEILADCASSVPSFEKDGECVVQYIADSGGKIIKNSNDVFADE